jgi:probable F420-dependent oxidoreductase
MKFWQHLTWVEIDQQIECARFAEELGFDGVVHGDHFCFPEVIRSRFPMSPDGAAPMPTDWPYPDLWVLIAAQAMATTRLRFAAGIYTMATRHPIVTAKATGTLALLSGNRAIIGVAPGWMKEEFDAAGIPFERRGERLDEAIAVTRKLWRGGAVEHHGAFYDFPPVRLEPMPGYMPPIYVGGSGDKAWRRAARLADGWIGGGDAPEDVPDVIATLTRLRADAGRGHLPFETIMMLTREATVDELKRLNAQGMDAMLTIPFNMLLGPQSTLDQKKRVMEDFARRYIAAFA